MNVALILIKRKSIFWNVYFEAKFTPFIALGLSSTCEGSLINDLNTTQVAYKRSSTDAKLAVQVSTGGGVNFHKILLKLHIGVQIFSRISDVI